MAHSLEELSEKRRRWVDVNRENGFDEGIKRLLTELYPDNAHFIYELLQNAEDAQAQEVRFILSDNSIEFEHDGKKLFSLEDVTAITSIGFSTKRDDTTNIGKFGVGFKAVFAYTNTPQIVSGGFSFQIQDMVVPVQINSSTRAPNARKTLTILPFDNPKKPAGRAINEIETLLRALDATTLLFLSNIRKIEYLLPDLSLGYIERINCGNNRFEIRVQQPGENESIPAYFLVFDKEVEVEDEEIGSNGQELKSCRIAVAFGLAPVEEKEEAKSAKARKDKNKSKWEVIPIFPGSVCIYFPADKETSSLRFHLHAPFASTVARDSVRDCSGNNALRDHLAELVAESMHKLREQGLLNVNCLAVLPNDKDSLTTFYKPFLTRLVKEFNEQELVPMKYGGHAAASGIFRGQRVLSDLIDDNDLVTLLGDDYFPPMWVANPPQLNQREDQFLSSLDIDAWTDDDLVSALVELDDESRATWLCKKDNAWHQNFYAYLEDHASGRTNTQKVRILDGHYITGSSLKYINLVKCSDGLYRKGDECFFPTSEIKNDESFPRVAKDVFISGKKENKKARDFLECIGVREVDESVEIEGILKTYYTYESKTPNRKKHYEHLRRFINFLADNPDETELFEEAYLFMADGKDGVLFVRSGDIYVDEPFKHTGLTAYYSALGDEDVKYPITVSYGKSGITQKELVKFAESIGARSSLDRLDAERLVRKLKEDKLRCSLSLSHLLWKSLTVAEENYDSFLQDSDQYHKGWGHYGTRYSDSYICLCLRTIKWIPQRTQAEEVIFVPPCDATPQYLPGSFEYKTGWGWLSKLEFGVNIEKKKAAQKLESERQTTEYKRKEDVLKEVGFESPEEAMELAKLKREDPDGFRRWRDSQKKESPFPSRPVQNPERRQERVEEQFLNSPTKHYETRNKSVRITSPAVDPAIWLRELYTNENGQMVCQICKDMMPFRKRNHEYYFEKREILSRNYLPKEHEAQHLALCPLCAAKYTEFVISEDAVMKALMEAILNAENFEIPIQLGDEKTSLRFVETHIHDLKTILQELADTRGNNGAS